MAFGLGKLEILESKLGIYEDLSKEMLAKLENAVSSIQENTNKTAIILERHENRLDEGDKANAAIIKMIEDHQKYDERMFDNMSSKMKDLEKKVEKNNKFVIGATAVLATMVTVVQISGPWAKVLTGAMDQSRLTTTPVVNELHREQVRQSPFG